MSDIYYQRYGYAITTPTSVVALFFGTPGAVTYSYRVSAVNLVGETLASSAVTVVNAAASLNISNYVRVGWAAVDGAFGYRVYGRTSGIEKLLATITSGAVSWDDVGTAVPSSNPPSSNTTEQVSWDEVLFRAGKVAQSCEMNDVQGVLWDQSKRLGDSVYEDGAIVEGCGITIVGTTATLAAGKIYFEGKVRDVAAGSVIITGVGTEYIGLDLTLSVVTDLTDLTLKDPAVGRLNFGKPGAHRKVITAVWVRSLTQPDVCVYHLVDGDVYRCVTDKSLYKVKVSENDTTPDYLYPKIVAGTGITITELDDGGNETLEVASSGASATVVAETSFGQASNAGAASTYSKGDHTHGTPTLTLSNTVEEETDFALTPDAGVGTSLSRGDHTHGTPDVSAFYAPLFYQYNGRIYDMTVLADPEYGTWVDRSMEISLDWWRHVEKTDCFYDVRLTGYVMPDYLAGTTFTFSFRIYNVTDAIEVPGSLKELEFTTPGIWTTEQSRVSNLTLRNDKTYVYQVMILPTAADAATAYVQSMVLYIGL